jgi:DNA polymerase III epsilon subunit-like protein
MSLIVVDVESDGQIPGDFSMVCFGAVIVEPSLSKTFYGRTKPISDRWDPEALAISGISRDEHLTFDDPKKVMEEFEAWIRENSKGKPVFISDNNGFDFAWVNWYFHHFLGRNPFGWSSRRIGDLYAGMQKDMFANWKWMRKTAHTHHPVDDCMGNAEAILKMKEMGLKIPK